MPTVNNNVKEIVFAFHDTPSRKILNVFDRMPFYLSSGKNSRMRETWFPMWGIGFLETHPQLGCLFIKPGSHINHRENTPLFKELVEIFQPDEQKMSKRHLREVCMNSIIFEEERAESLEELPGKENSEIDELNFFGGELTDSIEYPQVPKASFEDFTDFEGIIYILSNLGGDKVFQRFFSLPALLISAKLGTGFWKLKKGIKLLETLRKNKAINRFYNALPNLTEAVSSENISSIKRVNELLGIKDPITLTSSETKFPRTMKEVDLENYMNDEHIRRKIVSIENKENEERDSLDSQERIEDTYVMVSPVLIENKEETKNIKKKSLLTKAYESVFQFSGFFEKAPSKKKRKPPRK